MICTSFDLQKFSAKIVGHADRSIIFLATMAIANFRNRFYVSQVISGNLLVSWVRAPGSSAQGFESGSGQ
jgi:hypothetical protein